MSDCLNCDFLMIYLIAVIKKNHVSHNNHTEITVRKE